MRENRLQTGDIWLVLCDPSRGHEYRGTRPALIIQEAFLPDTEGIVTVMLMSSYKGRKWQNDILVRTDAHNRLVLDSLIKVKHIMSFDQIRFIKKIGVLSASHMEKVKEYLLKHFGLSHSL